MKQTVKLLAVMAIVILFTILAVLGITTSFADEVYDMYTAFSTTPSVDFDAETFTYTYGKTTATNILTALNAGKTVTSISKEDRDKSSFIYCAESNWAIYTDGRYELNGNEKTFPGTDSNGYAKAYILVAPGYVKSDTEYSTIDSNDERQYAWYFVTGQKTGTGNDLYTIATAYQNYKKSEIDVTVTNNGNTTVSGNNTIYGPIKVSYSYATVTTDSHSDEWGRILLCVF